MPTGPENSQPVGPGHTDAPSRQGAVPRRFGISKSTWSGTLLLLLPILAQLVLFKIVKYAILHGNVEVDQAIPQGNLVIHLFTEYAAVPALATFLAGFLVVSLSIRMSLSGPAAAGFFVGTLGVLIGGAKAILPFESPWLSADLLTVIRWDVVFVAAAAMVMMSGLHILSGIARAGFVIVTHLAGLIFMLLASLDFGYFAMTGSLADAYLLRYALTNLDNLLYVLSYEITGARLVFLLVPVAFIAVAAAYNLRRHRAGSESGIAWAAPALVSALVLAVAPSSDGNEKTALIADATFVKLAAHIKPAEGIHETTTLRAAAEPLFDTRNLTLSDVQPKDRLNIVVVILESQRDASFIKDRVNFSPTPFLDELRNASTSVDEMYAVVPHTNKALIPILCGVYPRIAQGDEPDVPGRCLPELLLAQGYESAFFTPAALAFERKDSLLRSMGVKKSFGDGSYRTAGFERINYFGFEDRIMLQPSLRWIDGRRQAGQPFLAVYLTVAPHHPYRIPSRFPRREYVEHHPDFNDYLNALAYVDGFLSDLFVEFERRNLLDSTIFVIVGDHGEAFGEHGLRYHSAVPYDEVMRVPALVIAPRRMDLPARISGPRSQLDLLPTLADLLSGELTGGHLPGRSLLAPADPGRRLYHAGWIENQSMALRENGLKYVYHFDRRPVEAFDLVDDPTERLDISARLSPALIAGKVENMILWRRHVNTAYLK